MDEYHAFNAILAVAMAIALVLALVARALQNRFIASELLLAMATGILVGPHGFDWVRLEHLTTNTHGLLEQAARLTLAIAIMTTTLRVGWDWTWRHARDLAVLLVIGLPVMWGLSWIVFSATLDLPLWPCLLLGAIVTPTDPVVAQSVVTSRNAEEKVPQDLRRLISAESAANDGLALLLVMIPLLALTVTPAEYSSDMARVVLWEVGGALLVGGLLGAVAGIALRKVTSWTTEAAEITVSVSLAFLTLSATKLVGMDGIFAVFGAGLGLASSMRAERQARHADFNHSLARLFHLPALVLLGMALPIDQWQKFGWPLVAAVVLILLFRRLPMLFLAWPLLRSVRRIEDTLFVGWFGPIGIAAVFYSLLAVSRTDNEDFFIIVTAVVVGSVIVHGLTDTVGAGAYAALRRRRERPDGETDAGGRITRNPPRGAKSGR